jgi:predicted oxidoreductase
VRQAMAAMALPLDKPTWWRIWTVAAGHRVA